MIETRAPGKLFVVGEYAVVEPGEPAVLVAVDRYLHVRLTERETAPECSQSEHVLAAIRVIDELRGARGIAERFFDLEITSELNDSSGRKFGLGSSAAVTVAVIEALDALYGLELGLEGRYKAALLATIEVSPRASGGDLAASTYGGWIEYASPDRASLRQHRIANGAASAMSAEGWTGFRVRQLPAPREYELLVGWTGSPASTEQLVSGVAGSIAGKDVAVERRTVFLADSRTIVESFVRALEHDESEMPSVLRRARALLQALGTSRGTVIETDALAALCDVAEAEGAAGKPSGAGGGDCGIALAGPGTNIPGILREWSSRGIMHLDLEAAPSRGPVAGGRDEH